MSIEPSPIEPIASPYALRFLTDQQIDDFQEATLRVLEDVGVQFPSEEALRIFEEHGAEIESLPCSSSIASASHLLQIDAMHRVEQAEPLNYNLTLILP